MNIKKNIRGFPVANFTDYNGGRCSIQDSSIATESCLWLGSDTGTHVDGKCLARMHLTQEMVKDLLPLLHRFAETGSIAEGKGGPDPTERVVGAIQACLFHEPEEARRIIAERLGLPENAISFEHAFDDVMTCNIQMRITVSRN